MPKVILNQIINQLETLDFEELQQLNQAVQHYLISLEISSPKERFHNALLASGLVKQIKRSASSRATGSPHQPVPRQLIQVKGEPVSETISTERR